MQRREFKSLNLNWVSGRSGENTEFKFSWSGFNLEFSNKGSFAKAFSPRNWGCEGKGWGRKEGEKVVICVCLFVCIYDHNS